MLYPILTIACGSIMVILSGLSLFRCLRDGGIFINQARFLASGILLILHFPLTRFLDGLILPWLEKVGAVEGNVPAAYWISVVLIVAVQLIILPTGRELYGAYMADRLARRAGA
ncbi:hypothetical protein Achl_4065 (plasmid) [Pseudarthrobacter chlorophenolicus A6]|uniref:Uncharacterized protein n=1 Tax=Pseudarthrobacter chlorophenolicus (strain ATCC 700700 / DSM 12829 / CIP 107037 / JCM 12360 / KCTC 9906 / NCIMB 13794 / A6) TaxID=452863 RepID=B8HHW9_PSECP|nr:hypothetical protein Achl_4065 [Pseudarthrobacter chlorophenolicus A6]SDQ20356.1 hypothetical protein SAMN04489738_0716 [Pseudarthrobacter chlorophenolicus]